MHRESKRLALGVLAILISAAAHAVPVRAYRLDITIGCVHPDSAGNITCRDELGGVHSGQTYSGTFSFDEDAFANDGLINTPLESFYFALGLTVWDATHPTCNITAALAGFCGTRRLHDPSIPGGDLLPTIWTLLIENHELVSVCCGVYAGEDHPLIDLFSPESYGFGGNGAHITAAYLNADNEAVYLSATGSWRITRVVEPSEPILLTIGLLFLIARLPLRTVN